jgi:hypothetical protein
MIASQVMVVVFLPVCVAPQLIMQYLLLAMGLIPKAARIIGL